jgi:hypothetical protein
LSVDASGQVDAALARVRDAGGTVLSEQPAVFCDPVGTCIRIRGRAEVRS